MPPVGKGAGGEGSPAVWKENGLYYPQPIDEEMGGDPYQKQEEAPGSED